LSRVVLIALVLSCFLRSYAQEASQDTVAVRASKDLGLYLGGTYSLNRMEATSYQVGMFEGVPELKNSPGVLAGFCYNFYAGNHLIIRPAVEVMFMPTKIAYQTEIDYVREQRIFPMTAEFPISIILSSFRTKSFPRPQAKPEVGLSVRPVISVKAFNDLEPVLNPYNLNTDVFVGYPFSNNKSVTRLELFYSHGWLNIIGSGTDYKTTSIQSLYRSAIGLRAIFH